jgi:hypothetical protein
MFRVRVPIYGTFLDKIGRYNEPSQNANWAHPATAQPQHHVLAERTVARSIDFTSYFRSPQNRSAQRTITNYHQPVTKPNVCFQSAGMLARQITDDRLGR